MSLTSYQAAPPRAMKILGTSTFCKSKNHPTWMKPIERRRREREHAKDWRRARGYDELPTFGTYIDHLTPLVMLALHTGCRRGELLSLRWSHVDLLAARVTVRGDSTKSGRYCRAMRRAVRTAHRHAAVPRRGPHRSPGLVVKDKQDLTAVPAGVRRLLERVSG